jgi:hypothetical protein
VKKSAGEDFENIFTSEHLCHTNDWENLLEKYCAAIHNIWNEYTTMSKDKIEKLQR